jgi:hypothetical protein
VNSIPVVSTNHLLQLTAIQRIYTCWRRAFDVIFAEMISSFSSKMADVFADFSKDERVKLAVRECSKEDGLSAEKAAKIYRIALLRLLDRLMSKQTLV